MADMGIELKDKSNKQVYLSIYIEWVNRPVE